MRAMRSGLKSARSIVYGALLGITLQTAAPAFQALHAAHHASEHAAVDAVAIASHDDFSRHALRSRPPLERHANDDAAVPCNVCKSHARLGSALPPPRTLTPDAVECDGAPTARHASSPRAAFSLGARPRAPPVPES